MKKIFLTFVIFLLHASPLFAETADKILAKVGSEVITQTDFENALNTEKANFLSRYGDKEGLMAFQQFQKTALDDMILGKLLQAEITREKISVPNREVQMEYQSRREQMRMSEPQFVSYLAKFGITLAQYLEKIKGDIEKQKFTNKIIRPKVYIPDYDIRQEYEANKDKFTTFTEARFIEVFLEPSAFPSLANLQQVAQQIHAGLSANKNVSQLIKKYSSGAFKESGGDSGFVKLSDLRSEIREVLMRLEPGKTAPVISAEQGIFIFKLLDQGSPQPLPYTQIAQMVRAKLTEGKVQEELKKHLFSVRNKTYVEILK